MRERLKGLFNEIRTFTLIELKAFRLIGFATTLIVLGIPFGVTLIILLLTGGAQSWGILYIGGGITLIISNLCLVTLSQRLINLRENGGIEFYYSLPISTISVQLGILIAYLILVIPMIFVFLFLTSIMFRLTINVSLWMVVLLLLSVLSFMGIGGIIGLYPKNCHRAQNLPTIVMFLVMFGTPIFWPLQVLPQSLQLFQRFFPFIYSVEGIRQCLSPCADTNVIFRDILALSLFSLLSLFLTLKLNLFQER